MKNHKLKFRTLNQTSDNAVILIIGKTIVTFIWNFLSRLKIWEEAPTGHRPSSSQLQSAVSHSHSFNPSILQSLSQDLFQAPKSLNLGLRWSQAKKVFWDTV